MNVKLVNGQQTFSGMRVETVGSDTIVTRIEAGKARRFILKDLVGYRGYILLESVDLIVAETSIWIDRTSFKSHGPQGSVNVSIFDSSGKDRFGGCDLVLLDNQIYPVSSSGVSYHVPSDGASATQDG